MGDTAGGAEGGHSRNDPGGGWRLIARCPTEPAGGPLPRLRPLDDQRRAASAFWRVGQSLRKQGRMLGMNAGPLSVEERLLVAERQRQLLPQYRRIISPSADPTKVQAAMVQIKQDCAYLEQQAAHQVGWMRDSAITRLAEFGAILCILEEDAARLAAEQKQSTGFGCTDGAVE